MKAKEILDSCFKEWGSLPFAAVSEKLLDCRAKSRLPQNAKSVICVLLPYLLDESLYEGQNVSKYAVVPDYHRIAADIMNDVCDKLKEACPDEEFVAFCDNAPVPEVFAAASAGLGRIGVNNLLINERYGSYIFIVEIVTTLDMGMPAKMPESCPQCGRCLDACPTDALRQKRFDLCLSAITQKKGELDEAGRRLVIESGCAWGCDKCQDACPLNARAEKTDIDRFIDGAIARVSLDTPIEGRAYAWRGKATIERNIKLFEK